MERGAFGRLDTVVQRRLGCSALLGFGCLAPGLTLLAFGAWVSAHGNGRFILLAGALWLVIGGSLFGVQAAAAGLFRKKPTDGEDGVGSRRNRSGLGKGD